MAKDKQSICIGVIGTGRITERFMSEISCVEDAIVTAVYNPNYKSAACFAKKYASDKYDIKAFEDIELFYQDIDAVYIASPHEYHSFYTREALNHGVHVLCEKPFAFAEREAKELFDLAEAKGLILMEAIKTAYAPGFRGLLKLVEDGVIGQVYDVEACFTKLSPANGREFWSEYKGSFCELGSYGLLPVVKLLGTDAEEIKFNSIEGMNGVDTYTKAYVSYENATATVKAGLRVKSEGELIIAGNRGYIRVPSPWWLTKRVEVHHENPNQVEVYEYPFEGSGLRYEIEEFVSRIEKGVDVKTVSLTSHESIWMASIMEKFLDTRKAMEERNVNCIEVLERKKIGVWAHRGCSMVYPENTLLAFQKAAEIKGLKGIELDVQLTKDGELVVIHDEKVDRTTNGIGRVCDLTLEEIKVLSITGSGNNQVYEPELKVPTLKEVLELLNLNCINEGLAINIELKNSVIRYEGMEEKVLELVKEFGLEGHVVYSSFLPESVALIRKLNLSAQTGVLASDINDCIEYRGQTGAYALHPSISGLDFHYEILEKLVEHGQRIPVRAWNGVEPFYGQNRELKEKDLLKYVALGVTDIITNVPEMYLKN